MEKHTLGQVTDHAQPQALHRSRGVVHAGQYQGKQLAEAGLQGPVLQLTHPPGQLSGGQNPPEAAWPCAAMLIWAQTDSCNLDPACCAGCSQGCENFEQVADSCVALEEDKLQREPQPPTARHTSSIHD